MYFKNGQRGQFERIDDDNVIYQTNCLYTGDGQVIGIRKLRDDVYLMVDISRGLFYQMKDVKATTDVGLVQEVQHRYLHNEGTEMPENYSDVWPAERFFHDHKGLVPCQR